MLYQSLHYLFNVADHYALTVSVVLLLIWALAGGFYIEETVLDGCRRKHLSRLSGVPRRGPFKVESTGLHLVAKTQTRL